MNYRHIYHAGVFADVVKHLTLVAILEQLNIKNKPYAVLDAFAGCGQYDLDSTESLKTNESAAGIKKLLNYATENIIEVPLLQKYLGLVKSVGSANIYPGSPSIIQRLMRSCDRLIASELQPYDFLALKRLFYMQSLKPEVGVHHLDAYKAIKAFIPFIEKRGLIFIDPPFEVKDEFAKITAALSIIAKRATNMVTMIWYPIKNIAEVENFQQSIKNLSFKELLKIEFALKYGSKNLEKCGLIIINPPNIYQALKQSFKYLAENVYPERAFFALDIIKFQ